MNVMPTLRGVVDGTVTLTAHDITNTVADPADSTAGIKLKTNGQAQRTGFVNPAYIDITGEWLVPAIDSSSYEVFATLDSGPLNSGTTGSWLSLGTEREWNIIQTSVGNNDAQITLQVRRIGTSITLATAIIGLHAVVTL